MKKSKTDRDIKLGLNIAYYRKLRGLSQMKLSELVGISRTQMSRIETAESSVSMATLFAICDVLEIKPNLILDFKD